MTMQVPSRHREANIRPLVPSPARRNGRLLARGELSLRRPNLPAGQSAAGGAARSEHIKPRLLGHWGTTPGLNFFYVHLNRLINENDLNMIYVIGPGHGGPGIVAHSYLEGSYTERYPAIERSRNGLQRLFRQFSWPYGIPSHVRRKRPAPSMKAANWAIRWPTHMARPSTIRTLIVACIVGDGEAETGALATSWHSNKFLNPGARWRGAPDPASQWLQDRQPDGAGAHQPRRN